MLEAVKIFAPRRHKSTSLPIEGKKTKELNNNNKNVHRRKEKNEVDILCMHVRIGWINLIKKMT